MSDVDKLYTFMHLEPELLKTFAATDGWIDKMVDAHISIVGWVSVNSSQIMEDMQVTRDILLNAPQMAQHEKTTATYPVNTRT